MATAPIPDAAADAQVPPELVPIWEAYVRSQLQEQGECDLGPMVEQLLVVFFQNGTARLDPLQQHVADMREARKALAAQLAELHPNMGAASPALEVQLAQLESETQQQEARLEAARSNLAEQVRMLSTPLYEMGRDLVRAHQHAARHQGPTAQPDARVPARRSTRRPRDAGGPLGLWRRLKFSLLEVLARMFS